MDIGWIKEVEKMKNVMVVRGMALCTVSLLALCSLVCLPPASGASYVPTWQVEEPMSFNMTQGVVVQNEDGMIYALGGVNEFVGSGYGAEVPDSYVFNPATEEWSVIAPMTIGVRGAAGAMGHDGKIYVIGGVNSSIGTVAYTQIYDPMMDSWSYGTDAPSAVWEGKAVAGVYDNEILLVGGEGLGSATYIYDTEGDSWSARASAPAAPIAGALVADGSYFYYFGGGDGGYSATDSVYRYYYWGDSWSTLDSMPVALASHVAIMGPDDLIYVLGGGSSGLNVGSAYNSSFCYNTETNEWTRLGNLSFAARYLGAATSLDGIIYALGGNDELATYDDISSLQVYVSHASLSKTTLNPGESFTVMLSVDMAYAMPDGGLEYLATILSSDGTPFNPIYGYVPGEYSSVAFDMTVSVSSEPGDYTVSVMWYIDTDAGSIDFEGIELEFTVLSAYTLEEQVAMLEENLTALQDDMAAQLDALSAQMDLQAEDISALQTEIAALQTQVTALEDALAALEASVSSDNQDLMDEITALQDQIALLQDSLDNVSADVAADDTDNTMNYVMIVLVIIVILLLVVMMLMRPKSVPPPPVE